MKHPKKSIIFSLLLILGFSQLKAQSDTIRLELDSLENPYTPDYSPSRAALYSAIFPGMGQVYNRKYWKLPIIYGLAGTLGYFVSFNNTRYVQFRNSFLAKSGLLPPERDVFPSLTIDLARNNQDAAKRDRDLLIILSVVLYGLNVVDAIVDAHFKTFDLSDELTLTTKPHFSTFQASIIPSFSVTLTF